MGSESSLRQWVWLLFFSFLAGSLDAQALYKIQFRSPAQATGQVGQTVSLGIDLSNTPDPVTAFSFGVKHDGTKLTVQAPAIGADLQAALGSGVLPDDRFYSVNLSPAGGPGFTVAMILTTDASTAKLPAGLDHKIFEAKYLIAQGAQGTATVQISGDLGDPKVPILLDLSGKSQAPVGTPAPVTTATVTITQGPPPFLRGDVNQSGRLDVTDGILIIDYLFGGASLPAGAASRDKCLVAFNVDGSKGSGDPTVEDAPDIELTDAIALLHFVFLPAAVAPPPPAAPYPTCGQPAVPVAQAFSCTEFTCK